jgi:hypothetical protein
MRNHKAGLCFAGNNHVSKVSVIGLDITLSSTKGKTLQKVRSSKTVERTFRYLFKQLSKAQTDHSIRSGSVSCTRVTIESLGKLSRIEDLRSQT